MVTAVVREARKDIRSPTSLFTRSFKQVLTCVCYPIGRTLPGTDEGAAWMDSTSDNGGVSVIIPAYNAERFIAATLESVCAQTYSRWEVVVVDDGSPDRSRDIAVQYAARDPRIRIVSQANAGLAGARNAGLRQSNPSNPYIIFLDSDDVWEPDALETLHEALARHPEWPAVHGQARTIDVDGQVCGPTWIEGLCKRWDVAASGRLRRLGDEEPTTFGVLTVRNVIATAGIVLIRRAALPLDGPFDKRINAVADWDLWLRLACHHPIGHVDQVVLGYRRHGTSMSKNPQFMWRSMVQMYRQAYLTPGLTPAQHALLGRWFERQWRRYAHGYMQWARDSARNGHWRLVVANVRRAIIAYGHAMARSPYLRT